jgi:hypothetical protein
MTELCRPGTPERFEDKPGLHAARAGVPSAGEPDDVLVEAKGFCGSIHRVPAVEFAAAEVELARAGPR